MCSSVTVLGVVCWLAFGYISCTSKVYLFRFEDENVVNPFVEHTHPPSCCLIHAALRSVELFLDAGRGVGEHETVGSLIYHSYSYLRILHSSMILS